MRKCSKCSKIFDDSWDICLYCSTRLTFEGGPLNDREGLAFDPSDQRFISSTNSKKRIPWAKWVFLIAIPLLVFKIAFSQSPSYYIDETPVDIRADIPTNRYQVYNGDFFRLIIHYPQNISRRIMGYGEHILSLTDATHYADITVIGGQDLKVRYRIKQFTLTNKEGIVYEPYNFQEHLYQDIAEEFSYGKGRELDNHAVSKITRSLSEIIPKVDFTYHDNLANVFYGYDLKDRPVDLVLFFEVEIYTLDGNKRYTVKDKIKLHRVNSDYMDYLRKK